MNRSDGMRLGATRTQGFGRVATGRRACVEPPALGGALHMIQAPLTERYGQK